MSARVMNFTTYDVGYDREQIFENLSKSLQQNITIYQ